ncbi:histone-lysine N-methyltransferase ATXR2 isoform X3 [Amborella trichopoda]|uniref:histone-lysine N-methyltransferase ATXR2 isoform X3 n=1 Tax=Amborella trichopoda TaxID=13333 RepID=UPI0005D366B2|nr:histone-lysine N-methyltransferase ATXR2 isoform X3 [Amborella trichopoda]|eukprot:XP_011625872.1 histone-lysine N-methyltransferase ATXR2 isoform X3 [Amborella trichopoda]
MNLSQYSKAISTLLASPSPQALQGYFDQLLAKRQCSGIKIRQSNDVGKGVYAEANYMEGDLVLKDQMLVGTQHVSNKVDALVCSYCFRYIGSIELQIGRKLYLQGLGKGEGEEFELGTSKHIQKEGCLAESLHLRENHSVMAGHSDSDSASSSKSEDNAYLPLPKEVIESLINGELVLPYSKEFVLPSVISCVGGCAEEHYCSKSCAEADWESCHSLLCMGERSGCRNMEALARFTEHANGTNDIFHLAAKVISSTILKCEKFKAAQFKDNEPYFGPNALGTNLLLEAWRPFSMGYKRRWWDCVALPNDIDCNQEASFRMQMRELAFTSLQLLKDSIFCEDYAPLFSLEIYGNIIGMFELNNLDVVVASPVEDYFIYIDDLLFPKKEEAMEVTQPILKALGDDYSICCQGTGFFPLQSCMNHSCSPNAKAFKRDEDRDGQAIIVAVRDIHTGEEITISYIDEDLPYEERQAALADYGFKCTCPKCLEESKHCSSLEK